MQWLVEELIDNKNPEWTKEVITKARKRAEEDLKLLSNRISLLKQEEIRAYKKID